MQQCFIVSVKAKYQTARPDAKENINIPLAPTEERNILTKWAAMK
jgi:hypothetical protein